MTNRALLFAQLLVTCLMAVPVAAGVATTFPLPNGISQIEYLTETGKINTSNREAKAFCRAGWLLLSASCSSSTNQPEHAFTHSELVIGTSGEIGWYCRVEGPITGPQPPHYETFDLNLVCAKPK